ncbi:MAG: hypothetical protein LBR81_03425 [Prevotellaceae bacterium]|jgi:hypothetical protein|nr:hypothetical protein [Prevotellaceae bacterium]
MNNCIKTYCDKNNEKQKPKLLEIIDFATRRENLFHTRDISQDKFDEFANKLLKRKNDIEQAKNFHELITIVYNEKIPGIGHVNVYDVAEIIGESLELYPEMVYLHAGVETGAKKYFGNKYEEVIEKKDNFIVIRKKHFLPKFKKFTCDHLESALCMTNGNLDIIL